MGLVANFDIFTDNAQALLRDRWAQFYTETADRLERCGGTEEAVEKLRSMAEEAQNDYLHLDVRLVKSIRFNGSWYEVRVNMWGPCLGYKDTGTDMEEIRIQMGGCLSASKWDGERTVALLRLEMHDLGSVIREEMAKLILFFNELDESGQLRDEGKIKHERRQYELRNHISRTCDDDYRREADEFWEKHRDAILSADMEGEALYSYKPTKTHERKVIRALAACDMLEVTERRGQPWFLKPTSQAYAVAKANGHLTVEETPDSKLLANFFRNVKKGQVAQKNC